MDNQDASRLRIEIQNLLPRAAALVVATPLAKPSSAPEPAAGNPAAVEQADLDRMIEQASAVEVRASACLAADDALLGELRVVLGSLYASRCTRFGWSDDDRAEGLRRYRAARAGGHLTAEKDPSAMLLFAVLLLPSAAATFDRDATGALGKVLELSTRLQASGPLVADLKELRDVLDEVVAARPDDPRLPPLIATSNSLSGVLGLIHDLSNGQGATVDRLTELIAGMPTQPTGRLASFMNVLIDQGRVLERRQKQLEPEQPAPPPVHGVQPDDAERFIQEDIKMLVELSVPGSISPAELTSLIKGYEADGEPRSAAIAAIGRLAAATRTNDPEEMALALRNVREVAQSPEAEELSWLLTSVYPAMLAQAAATHGNIQDGQEALNAYLRGEAQAPKSGRAAGADPDRDGLDLVTEMFGANLRLGKALDDNDVAAIADLVAKLDEAGPPGEAEAGWRFMLPLQQALTKLGLAVRRGDRAMAREAQAHMRTVLDTPVPEALRALMGAAWSSTHMVTAVLENQPAEIAKAVADARSLLSEDLGLYDGAVQTRVSLASGLMAQYLLSDGSAKAQALSEAIDVLEQAEGLLTERTSSQIAGRVLWSLADALRTRHDAALRDNRRAVALTRDSLGLVAGDVLLQLGAEHGLQAARAGALRGLRAAGWALEEHRVEDAIEVLELGRGLVLRATATAGTVPDRLRAVGEVELAEQWERSVPAVVGKEPGTAEGLAALDLPSDLRRRALDALRAPRATSTAVGSEPDSGPGWRRDLFTVPTLPQIAEALDRAGLDALVYLLPGTEGVAGKVLMILGNGGTRELPLGDLGKVADYLDKSATRYQRLRGAEPTRDLDAEPSWEVSLDELCAWAGTAVLDRVIAALPVVPTPESPARVVIIACGQLGLVPWHAATLPPKPSTAGLSRPPRACDVLVVSYAASADELLRSLSRRRTPYAADPVLVVDPSSTLRYAEAEAVTVRRAYLPTARLMGSVKGEEVEAPGTPEQVHAALTGGDGRDPASMVQIIAHGTASTRPTASRLWLARPDAAGAAGADGRPGRDEAGPEYLTVAGIVDASRPGSPDRFCSLVVLDCCETDLSSRDHDEALTLTTAFVARGATDVIGSRWAVDDWATAVCMIVLHHHLAAGLTPAEALRAAQRWMLDTGREVIPAVSEYLLQDPQTPLEDVSNWAPFIHQGKAGLS